MQQVTVSSKGQVAIPKPVREALNLADGDRLTLEVRGQKIVLSKSPAWKKLRGAGRDVTKSFRAFRKEERELEDPRP